MVPGRGVLGCLQRARGRPRSRRSRALAPRPPLPAPGRRGPRRPARPLRARPLPPPWNARHQGGAPAEEQGRAQELPQLAKPLGAAARELLQRRPLSGVERSCSPPLAHLGPRTCAGPGRRGQGGAAPGAGPRYLSASPRGPPPGSPGPRAAEEPTGDLPEEEENLEISGTLAAAENTGRLAQRSGGSLRQSRELAASGNSSGVRVV